MSFNEQFDHIKLLASVLENMEQNVKQNVDRFVNPSSMSHWWVKDSQSSILIKDFCLNSIKFGSIWGFKVVQSVKGYAQSNSWNISLNKLPICCTIDLNFNIFSFEGGGPKNGPKKVKYKFHVGSRR